MSEKFIEEMRQQLLKEQEVILNTRNIVDEELDSDGDEVDQIQAKQIQSINSNIEAINIKKLEQISVALAKIKDGVYGSCEECEEEIPEKRLRIKPYFSMCVRCAEIKEKQNKSFRK